MKFLGKHERRKLEFDLDDSNLRVKAWPGLGVIEVIQDSEQYGLAQIVIPIRHAPKMLDMFMRAWVKACQVANGLPDGPAPAFVSSQPPVSESDESYSPRVSSGL